MENPDFHFSSNQFNLSNSIDQTDISIDDIAQESKKEIMTIRHDGQYQVSMNHLSPVLVKKKKSKAKIPKNTGPLFKGGT